MLTLVLIGLLGGLITAVSSCILPVLPAMFLAGGGDAGLPPETGPSETGPPSAARDRDVARPVPDGGSAVLVDDPPVRPPHPRRNRRPYAVVTGIVVSFGFFTLLGVTIISALGPPQDILRRLGLGVLVMIGLGLIFPPVAGPVLAAIAVAGARGDISSDIVALTLSFALGTVIPLLVFALAGRRVSARVAAFRTRARGLRIAAGTLTIVLAFALAFDATTALQRALPDYTAAAQKEVEDSDTARRQLSGLYDDSNKELSACEDGVNELRPCGQAPPVNGITKWLNTPDGQPVDLTALRGKVVLIDFWTYSCINCRRSLPHVKDWDRAYKSSGLQVIGVHSPEFAFEKDPGNVADQTRKLGVGYPVALDNQLATWNAYRNRFRPAKYLIDANGTVRHFTFGEGRYDQTEDLIRTLLRQADPGVKLPPRTGRGNDRLTAGRTPETYLNTPRLRGYTGTPLMLGRPAAYRFPATIPLNGLSLDGTWTAAYEQFTAGDNARLAITYRAKNANLVLAGEGPVTVLIDGKKTKTIQVHGAPTLYRLTDDDHPRKGRLELRPAPGIQAFAFTFG
ncbi:redoxin domain-containing protein [Streptomyces sp. CJ_13]|uniref:redoxin domain-containing protein n=1 Tax=Streptomyces sp. CJ_13 TaxID=2724943 RepID=UPI001BDCAE32|nr:redoxin domain-containing protein [Streptomyces sp. CJ_13]MBT1188219.1 redoxin domain-containing protein [Streptomyces sp. CJ_13]